MEYLIRLFIRSTLLLVLADPTLFTFKKLWKTLKRYRRTKEPAARQTVRHELLILLGVTIALFGFFCFYVVLLAENPLEG